MSKVEQETPGTHRLEGCKGEFLVEYQDALGIHRHCPVCGSWDTVPIQTSSAANNPAPVQEGSIIDNEQHDSSGGIGSSSDGVSGGDPA